MARTKTNYGLRLLFFKYLNNFKLSILEVKICENDDKISIFGNREITFNYHSEEFSKYKTFVTKRLK